MARPYVAFGITHTGDPLQILDLRDLTLRSLGAMDPALQGPLASLAQRDANTNDRGDRVHEEGNTLVITMASGAVHRIAKQPNVYEGAGIIAYRFGDIPWLWTPVAGGSNEQVFACGRPLTAAASGGDALYVEMPSSDLQVEHNPNGDTWELAGFARGNHGTPDYPDGLLYVVLDVPATTPRDRIESHLTPFNFPIRLPEVVDADVWTYGDYPGVMPGTIGGGTLRDRPNRQGIGLWSAADAAKGFGVVDTPWLDLDAPILGIWISPYDATQGLRAYDETRFEMLIKGHRVEHLAEQLRAMYREERARGGFNMAAIEELIARDLCQRFACNLTVYDDHELIEVAGSEGTRYKASLLDKCFSLQREGFGVALAVNVYPAIGGKDDQAIWAFENMVQAMNAGPELMRDGATERMMPGWEWLGLTETEGIQPIPVVFGLALFTYPHGWAPTKVARRLESAVRIGQHTRVIGYDIFGFGRPGETPEWTAWAKHWYEQLLVRTQTGIRPKWPLTKRREVPRPPAIVFRELSPAPSTSAKWLRVVGENLANVTMLIAESEVRGFVNERTDTHVAVGETRRTVRREIPLIVSAANELQTAAPVQFDPGQWTLRLATGSMADVNTTVSDGLIYKVEASRDRGNDIGAKVGAAAVIGSALAQVFLLFRSKKPIIVNGAQIETRAGRLEYKDIVKLAYPMRDPARLFAPGVVFTITYHLPSGASGTVTPGESMPVEKRAIINCYETGNA